MDEFARLLEDKKQEPKLDHLRLDAYLLKINVSDIKHMNHLKSLYDATILEFDTEIMGPLMNTLKKLDLYENSIVVLCADHGDEFGEHGKLGHGEALYDEVIHVPLIIKLPWPQKGSGISELTQTVDIMPTVLELNGIPLPHYSQGKSLLPLLRQDREKPFREYVYGQILNGTQYIRSKEWKLIMGKHHRKELYHLSTDPEEKKNLYSFISTPARKLKKKLRNWQRSLPSYKQESLFLPHVDKATRERIKRTGYW
jgi:arylsulfatase A-like enzyme